MASGDYPTSAPLAAADRQNRGMPNVTELRLVVTVEDYDEALRFYRDVLGFELQAHLGTAAFVSAGGYHHHLGFNTWKSRGGKPQPDGVAGLHHVAFLFPSQTELARTVKRLLEAGVEPYQALDHGTHLAVYVTDPDGNVIEISHNQGVYAKAQEVWG